MKIKMLIGFLGLKLADILPMNDGLINLGQRHIRSFFASMFLVKSGVNIDIQKYTRFSHFCELGNNSGIGEGSRLYGKVLIGDDVMMGPQCWIYTQNHEFRYLDSANKVLREKNRLLLAMMCGLEAVLLYYQEYMLVMVSSLEPVP